MKKFAISALALAAFAGVAAGQESFNFTNVISNGPVGNAVNQNRSISFANSFLWDGSITVSGLLTEINTGTFASEARIRVQTTSNGTGTPSSGFSATGGFTGSIAIGPATRALAGLTGLPINTAGQTWNLNFFESFDDGGTASLDANWDDVTVTFNRFVANVPTNCINLGSLNANQIDTLYSANALPTGTDTEMALYDANGNVLGQNDDHGTGGPFQYNSLLAPGTLVAGATYYLAVGGFNSTYGFNFATTSGTATGNYGLRFDGATVASGALVSGAQNWYCFTAIPAPSAAALMGLGLVAAGRRRR